MRSSNQTELTQIWGLQQCERGGQSLQLRVQANLENQTGVNQELFGILGDLLNLQCRKPTQTKHSGLCRERKTGLHLRQSPEGQGEGWGQLGNWRNEMVYQTGHRKNLKNAKISSLSNEP